MQATATLTLADTLFPRTGTMQRDLLRDLVLIVGFTVMMSLVAQIRIPLPNSPVPITGQTFGVLLTGAALGSRRGAASMALYVIVGGMGLPVFAGWGTGLFWSFASGGYIIGFVPAAFIVGWLAERGWDRRPRILVAMLLGNIVLYVPGLIQLEAFFEGKAFVWGLWPFIPGDLAKLYLASLAMPTAWSLALKYRSSIDISTSVDRFLRPPRDASGPSAGAWSPGGLVAAGAGFASMVAWSVVAATRMEVGVFDVTDLAFGYYLWFAASVLLFGLGLNLLARGARRESGPGQR